MGIYVQRVEATVEATATSTTAIPIDDTIPQNTEGSELITKAITPTNSSNRLIIQSIIHCSPSSGGKQGSIALFQDSTVGALTVSARQMARSADDPLILNIQYIMVAGTTSATTFKIRGGCEDTTTFQLNQMAAAVFGGVMFSRLVITEVTP